MPSVEETRRTRKAFEEIGHNFVKYFPVLVAVFAAIYISYRISMELGMGDDLKTMPGWLGIVGIGMAIAALVFGKFIRGRIGWAAAVVFVAWFILSPDFVYRSEQVKLDHDSVIRSLQTYARSVSSCKGTTALMKQQGTVDAASVSRLVEQCDDREKVFLDVVAKSTNEQLSSICGPSYRDQSRVVDAVCAARNL